MCKSIDDDIEYIYPFMRQVDKIECGCMGYSPKEALEVALGSDDVTFTAFDPYGVPFCMFGAGSLQPNKGYIWMLGTDSVEENKFDFIKASRFVVKTLTEPYGKVTNFVHKNNRSSIEWLKWCGAEMGREIVFSDHPFYEFTITHKEKE